MKGKVTVKVPPILLYVLVVLSITTETIYSAALPSLTQHFGTIANISKLSSTTYPLGFAVGILTLGRISDIYGRRPVILFGTMFYFCASMTMSYATSIEQIIILRFFQAYGASVGSVIGQAMTRDSYQGWELSYIYASIAIVIGIAPTVGSALGGMIIQNYSWEYIFYFLTLFGICIFLINLIFLPESNSNRGLALSYSYKSVAKEVLKDKVLLCNAFIVGAFNGICFGFYVQAPFIFIDYLKMEPYNYGKLFIILTVSNLVGAIGSRYMIKKYFYTYNIILSGFVFCIIGCVSMFTLKYFVDSTTPVDLYTLSIFLPMMLQLIGHNMIVPMVLRHALENYYKVTGTAGSIFGSLYYFLTAFVIFIISYLHSENIYNYSYIYAVALILAIVAFSYVYKQMTSEDRL